jgi:flagellar hook-length control protein FliK
VENVDKPAAANDADATDARTRNSAQPNTPEKLTIAANSPPRQEDAQQEATDPLINQDSEPTGDVSADKKQTIATKPEIPENVGKEFRSKDGLKRAEQAADTKRTDSGDVKASHTASRAAQAAPPAEKKQSKRATHEVSQVDKSTASSATANHRDALNYNTATTTAPDVADLSTGEKNQVASDAGAEAAESTAKAGSEITSTAEPRSSRRVALPVGTPSGRATGEGDGLNTVGRARFVQRVARAFQALGDRGGPLRLRLSPPELGSLRMEVEVRGGLVTAHIEAESPQARAMLLENLPALRDRLAAQDIKIERFDVDLMDQSPDGLPQTPQEDRRAAQQERRAAANVKRTTQTANDPRNDEVTRPSPAGDGQFNVVV